MTPVASQQVVTLMLDMFMAGKRVYPTPPNQLHPYRHGGADDDNVTSQLYVRVPLIPPQPGPKILMCKSGTFSSVSASAGFVHESRLTIMYHLCNRQT
jgi:hypothetical protein